MSTQDRKESLLKTIKLQNDQLEQWEKLRLISRDPDEQLRCDIKIEDIKALVSGNEAELKNLSNTTVTKTKQKESSVTVKNMGAATLKSNQIGFKISENKNEINEAAEPYDQVMPDVGDDVSGIKKNFETQGTHTVINLRGKDKQDQITPKEEVEEILTPQFEEQSSGKKDMLLASICGCILLSTFGFELLRIDPHYHIPAALSLAGLILSVIAVAFVCLYKPISNSLNMGLKFAISLLILATYAAVLFWGRYVFKTNDGGKEAGEVIFLPVIIVVIGSIIVLVNEENKRAKRKAG